MTLRCRRSTGPGIRRALFVGGMEADVESWVSEVFARLDEDGSSYALVRSTTGGPVLYRFDAGDAVADVIVATDALLEAFPTLVVEVWSSVPRGLEITYRWRVP